MDFFVVDYFWADPQTTIGKRIFFTILDRTNDHTLHLSSALEKFTANMTWECIILRSPFF